MDADVELRYTLRHVLSGDSTYEERDDKVEELTSNGLPQTVTLIPARDASPAGFVLKAQGGAARQIHTQDRTARAWVYRSVFRIVREGGGVSGLSAK